MYTNPLNMSVTSISCIGVSCIYLLLFLIVCFVPRISASFLKSTKRARYSALTSSLNENVRNKYLLVLSVTRTHYATTNSLSCNTYRLVGITSAYSTFEFALPELAVAIFTGKWTAPERYLPNEPRCKAFQDGTPYLFGRTIMGLSNEFLPAAQWSFMLVFAMLTTWSLSKHQRDRVLKLLPSSSTDPKKKAVISPNRIEMTGLSHLTTDGTASSSAISSNLATQPTNVVEVTNVGNT